MRNNIDCEVRRYCGFLAYLAGNGYCRAEAGAGESLGCECGCHNRVYKVDRWGIKASVWMKDLANC